MQAGGCRKGFTERETPQTNAMNGITLELILERRNLSQALDRVERNDGAPGVDGMRTDELRQHICRHPHELTEAIRAGTYRPSPVLRTEIPKEESGKLRELGIPTVQDRLVQQAIAQVGTGSRTAIARGAVGFLAVAGVLTLSLLATLWLRRRTLHWPNSCADS